MPRRNINAAERLERKWSVDYIRTLLYQLKNGISDEPLVVKFENNTNKWNKKSKRKKK